MSEFDCDVLVVGLGPTGDVLSALLQQQGVSVIAIDREPQIFALPRAAAFDQEIMRIFQMIDVAMAIEPFCRVPQTYQFQTKHGEILLEFPTPQNVGKWGWMSTYFLHQPAVEHILRGRLSQLGVDMRTNTSFTHMEQDADGITAHLVGRDGPYAVRARYLVGCDGASSPVRETMAICMFDYQFDEPWLVIDSIIDDGHDLPQIAMQICDPDRPTTFLRMSGNRYRWEFMMKPGEDPDWFASDDNLARLLAPWNVLHRAKIERRSIYRFHALVTNEWREGRVMLAGDAAHQMPPFAGQGMCSGIRDAANLAWKLAWVVRERASETLLDSYQIEREPHVRVIIDTAIEMGRTVCVLDPGAAADRDAAMLARKAGGAQDVSVDYPPIRGGCLTDDELAGTLFIQPVIDDLRLDDALGDGPWLIGRKLPQTDMVARHITREGGAAAFAFILEDWLSQHDIAAVLVRPDRHIFGVGDPVELLVAWEAALDR